jgi:hypothetical protein
MASAALASFAGTLRLAESLLLLESTYPDPPPTRDEVEVKALRGGAAVLMVAAFEDYLRTVIQELLDPYQNSPPLKPLSQLPERLQVASVFHSLQHALKGPRHGKPGKRIDRLPDVQQACTLAVQDRVDASALANTGGNPNSECVADLLKQLDIQHPMAQIKKEYERLTAIPVAHTFVQDTLDAIVSRRHSVAHTATTYASRTDLTSSVAFLRTLAEAVDVVVAARVTAY